MAIRFQAEGLNDTGYFTITETMQVTSIYLNDQNLHHQMLRQGVNYFASYSWFTVKEQIQREITYFEQFASSSVSSPIHASSFFLPIWLL